MKAGRLFPNQDNTIQMPNVKKGILILSRRELPTMVNGLADSETEMEFKNGRMVHSMKVSGRIIELMEKANLFILTETFMTENG